MLNIIWGTWGLSITLNKLEEHNCVVLGIHAGIRSRPCVFCIPLHPVLRLVGGSSDAWCTQGNSGEGSCDGYQGLH